MELDHFGRRLAEASEKLEKAVQSRNPLEMRYTALELVPVLSQYCDSAIKGDSHEMRHIIDALQTAVHTILPETRRAHVHMGKSQSAVQTNDDDLAHAGHR